MKHLYMTFYKSKVYILKAANRVQAVKRMFDYFGIPQYTKYKIITWKNNKTDFDVLSEGESIYMPFAKIDESYDKPEYIHVPEDRLYFYAGYINNNYHSGYVWAKNYSDSFRKFCKHFKLGHPRYKTNTLQDVYFGDIFVCRSFIPDVDYSPCYKTFTN